MVDGIPSFLLHIFGSGHTILAKVIISYANRSKKISGGRVLRLTGLTPEEKIVKKRISWVDVGRNRWGEFKKDLEKIKSGS